MELSTVPIPAGGRATAACARTRISATCSAPAIPGLLGESSPPFRARRPDLTPDAHIQAIANTAAFHFAFIEQGGSSLYPKLAQRVSSVEVLRILLQHRADRDRAFPDLVGDKAGNFLPVTDPVYRARVAPGRHHAAFQGNHGRLQANLIMPEPTVFLSRRFPVCSIIRPTETQGPRPAQWRPLKADELFIGQSDGSTSPR